MFTIDMFPIQNNAYSVQNIANAFQKAVGILLSAFKYCFAALNIVQYYLQIYKRAFFRENRVNNIDQ